MATTIDTEIASVDLPPAGEVSNLSSVVGLLSGTRDLLSDIKALLNDIKSNGIDVKSNTENVGPVLSDIRAFLKDLKGGKEGSYALRDANLPKMGPKSNDAHAEGTKSDEAYEDPSSQSNMIPDKISGAISETKKAIEEPPSRFDMTLKKISEEINKFVTAVGTIDKELEKFVTEIRHIGSSKRMIDDITNFRSRLRPFAVLYVAHLVIVWKYEEWAETQKWYKIDYFETHLKDILLKSDDDYTKEEKKLTDLNVYDVIVNFVTSAKRLHKTMSLFLDFTAKAADVKLVLALLESVSQLAPDPPEYYMFSFRQPYFESKFKKSLYEATYQDLDVSIHSYMYLHKVLDDIVPSLIIFSTPLVDFNDPKNGGLTTLKPYQEEAKSNITNTITVATFFSAITATTIQFSYTSNSSHLQSSVNVFWLCSLVLSVASVLQSLLAYLWRQAITSPASRTPTVYSNWVIQTPMILLAISVVMFSIGLYIFAFSSHQRLATALATVVFAFCGFLSLIIPFLHFLFDKITHAYQQSLYYMRNLLGAVEKKGDQNSNNFSEVFGNLTKILHINYYLSVLSDHHEERRGNFDFDKITPISSKQIKIFVEHVSFSPNGKHLSIANDENARIYEMGLNQQCSKIAAECSLDDRCHSISWSPDNRYCIFVGVTSFCIWDRDKKTSNCSKRKLSFSMGTTISWLANSNAFLITDSGKDQLLRYDLHSIKPDSPQEAKVECKLVMDFKSLNRGIRARAFCATSLNTHGKTRTILHGWNKLIEGWPDEIMICNIENGRIESEIATIHYFDQITSDRSGKKFLMRTDKIIQLWTFDADFRLKNILPLPLEDDTYLHDCCFGAHNDDYALGITNQHIYIWSTESGECLKRVNNAEGDDRILWNPAATDVSMFVTWDFAVKKFLNIWGTQLSIRDIEQSHISPQSDPPVDLEPQKITENTLSLDGGNKNNTGVKSATTDGVESNSLDVLHSSFQSDVRAGEEHELLSASNVLKDEHGSKDHTDTQSATTNNIESNTPDKQRSPIQVDVSMHEKDICISTEPTNEHDSDHSTAHHQLSAVNKELSSKAEDVIAYSSHESIANHAPSYKGDEENADNPALAPNDVYSTLLDRPHSTLNVQAREHDDEVVDTSTRPYTAKSDEEPSRDSESHVSTSANQCLKVDKGKARADDPSTLM